MTVSGKRIVVTGGARGIGAALADELRSRDAEVITADLLPGADVDVRRQRRRPGRQPVRRRRRRSTASSTAPPCSSTASPTTRSRSTNGTACSPSTCAVRSSVLGPLRRRWATGGGSIVNVASETALTGSHGFVHYVASKGAVLAMTRALANELGRVRHPGELRGTRLHADTGVGSARTVRPEPHAAGTGDATRRPARHVLLSALGRLGVRLRPNDRRQRRTRSALRWLTCSPTTTRPDWPSWSGTATSIRSNSSTPRSRASRISTPQLNSVIHRQFERARREASGPLPDGPFRGVPFLFKDLGCAEAGEPHHQGMRALRDAQFRATDGQRVGTGVQGERVDPPRTHERARAGLDGHHRARRLRPDAQPVEHRPLPRRIVRRLRGRRRRRSRSGRPRQRHRRLDPHPRRAVRRRRAQADVAAE